MTLTELIEQCARIEEQVTSTNIPLVNFDGAPFEISGFNVIVGDDGKVSHIAVGNSEGLQPGTYAIPENCTFKYANRKIIIVPKKIKDAGILRCGTCKHIKTGNKCCKSQYWDTQYCELRPKTIGGKTEYFYHVSPSTKACDKYEEA